MAGYEAPLRVGYNKVTHGELTHTQRRSHTEKVISGEVVLTTLMPIVIIIIFILYVQTCIHCILVILRGRKYFESLF